jgi:iron-sulfur cluster insertion protein
MQVTPAAVSKIAEILNEEDEKDLGLRIAVKGGGCSGFQYDFSLDRPQKDFDMIAELAEGVQLMIDSMSISYLEEATLDYHDDKLNGSAFVIKNPNAKTTCGCGSSFSA